VPPSDAADAVAVHLPSRHVSLSSADRGQSAVEGEITMSNPGLGMAVGMGLGFAAAFGGPEAFAIVLAAAVAGLFAGRAVDGAGDPIAVTESVSRRTREIGTVTVAAIRLSGRRARFALGARAAAWRRRTQTIAADTLGAWSGRLRAGSAEETTVLRLSDLTEQTVELRPRRGLLGLRTGWPR
jgi:hypothetical protein